MLDQLSSYQITLAESMDWNFTTTSGGVWKNLLTLDETYPSMRPINDGPRAAPERLSHTTEPLLSAPHCSARYRSVHGLHQPSPNRQTPR